MTLTCSCTQSRVIDLEPKDFRRATDSSTKSLTALLKFAIFDMKTDGFIVFYTKKSCL